MRAGIFTTTIQEIQQFGADTRHFRVAFPAGTEFRFQAGQFVNFILDLPGQPKTIKRPYSIASPPIWNGYLDFIWKRVEGGIVTNHLWDMKQGEPLKIQGPLGVFTFRKPMPKNLVFVSTGTGIAPFRSMIHELVHQGTSCKIWNFFGTRYEDQILYQNEFEELAKKYAGLRNVFTVSRPRTWTGEKDYVQILLKKYIQDVSDTHIYICGLTKMIQDVVKTATEMGFVKEQLFFEKYD